MVRLLEVIIGLLAIFWGLDRFERQSQIRGLFLGLVAIAGLVLVVQGILLYLVPNFFKPSF